jgi:hypothetical protein
MRDRVWRWFDGGEGGTNMPHIFVCPENVGVGIWRCGEAFCLFFGRFAFSID